MRLAACCTATTLSRLLTAPSRRSSLAPSSRLLVRARPSSDIMKRVVLPYKSKDLCRTVRSELHELNNRLGVNMQPVFTSCKVRQLITSTQPATDRIIQHSKVVYLYRCSCDMSYIGFTGRHLHQRIAEHRRQSSSIQQHCSATGHDFCETNFSVIAKCKVQVRLHDS